MLQFTISAPGKVILYGEHAVVYGKRALAASLGLRTYLNLITSKTAPVALIKLNFTSIYFKTTFKFEEIIPLLFSTPTPITSTLLTDAQYAQQIALIETFLSSHAPLAPNIHNALLSFLFLLTCILSPSDLDTSQGVSLDITVNTELTVSAGLGSSASFLVCVAGAFCCYSRYKAGNSDYWVISDDDLREFSNWAFNAERIIHGTPSGVDNTICTFGALVEFRKGFPPVSIPFPEDTGIFKLRALLINSRVPKDTKKMVASVADLNQRHPKVVGRIFDAIDEVTASALDEFKVLSECLKNNKPVSATEISEDIKNACTKLQQLFPINQSLLSALGVSHRKLDHVCELLAEHFMLAKLTGAGGGGYAIALVPTPLYTEYDIEEVVVALEDIDCDVKLLELGGFGLRVELHSEK